MARAPFHNSRVKIARTKQLINQLAKTIEDYDGAALVASQSGPDRIGWRVRVKFTPNDEVEAILGDVVHNLRASLDLAAVTAVELNEGNPKNVHFPFAESADQLDSQIKQKKFHRASGEAQNLVRKLKPYKGGNVALRGIHDLDLLDKHNDLIPVYGVAEQTGTLQIAGISMTGNTFGLQDGMGVVLSHPGVGAILLAPHPLRLNASFGPQQPFAGAELIPTLRSLTDLVGGIVDAFAALYAR